ncbi:unnamed protein product [Phytomonas sp. Hart1]|nr:unnamed protein product [Phytomonas sp. Hart1]|eukprot:CCW70520.1 unnamed protein product [Phytomonas sp. isolate Hart1]
MLRVTFSRPYFKTTVACACSDTQTFSFSQRFEKLLKDPQSPLNSQEYVLMRECLTKYRTLQRIYSVKQTDIERARAAAHVCGLEFTKRRHPPGAGTGTQ